MPRNADTLDNVFDEHDAALAQAAQRCFMTALDHSRAAKIRLVSDGKSMPSVVLLPQKTELSTQDAAAFLSVSRPFVVKQIDEGRLDSVNQHGR